MVHDDQFQCRLEAARQGSTEALGYLLLANHRPLLELAKRNVGILLQSKLDPADLVQATALEAHRSFRVFRGDSPQEFQAWLRRILLNRAVTVARHYRRARKRDVAREESLEDHRQWEVIPKTEHSEPERDVIHREEAWLLNELIQALPTKMRTACVMHLQHHKTFQEIGVTLECSTEAARKLYSRAKLRLQREIIRRGGTD